MATKRTSLEAQILAVCNAHAEGISDAALTEKLKDSCSVEARADALNKLLTDYRIQVFKSADGEHLIYKAVSAQDAIKYVLRKGLGSEDQLVLQCISSAGNVGVWTRDMKNRTHLPQTKINRILKVLEERGLVKHVKSMQNASKKVYILAELEPAKEITGGPWYGPDSFDLEFIKVLQKASRKHIKDSGQANLHDILDFIVSSVRCIEAIDVIAT
ncbi:Rpc34 subunit of RNA polymerase, partial [Helicosporidium sp. ATCC 50920]